jgi:hypothetical protein
MFALILQSDFQRIYSKRLLWDYEADKYHNHKQLGMHGIAVECSYYRQVNIEEPGIQHG